MLKLRELRNEQGKTQSEMAKIFQISRQVYANYENGINEPSLDMLIKMSDIFDVSVDYLLGLEDDGGMKPIKFAKENSALGFSQDEVNLIKDYRSLAPALQEMLRATIQTWKGTSANTGTKPNRA